MAKVGPNLNELAENENVAGEWLVLEKKLLATKNGQSYLAVTLGDKTGRLMARIWDGADRLDRLFTAGDLVWAEGRVNSYRGQLQLNIGQLKPAGRPEDALAEFLPAAARPIPEMAAELRAIAADLTPPLKDLCLAFLDDEDFMARFGVAPAAKAVHHVYVGGLLDHTLCVARLALAVADHYSQLHRDLLVTGAILHDVGKAEELTFTPAPDYTAPGRLLGHVVIGVGMVRDRLPQGFPPGLADEVLHLIVSHHGLLEFGSPKLPMTLEAAALNMVDDLDAKLTSFGDFMDQAEGDWTDYNRLFERYFYRGSADRPEAIDRPEAAPAQSVETPIEGEAAPAEPKRRSAGKKKRAETAEDEAPETDGPTLF